MPVRPSHGTWEALVLPVKAGGGRPRPYAHHARHEGVRQRHSTAETLEPGAALPQGGGGGKAVDQGEHVPIARSPDAEPGACVAWVGACASRSVSRYAVLRQTPEVGAVCGKSARTDLRGGCRATGIPTAIMSQMFMA